MAPLKTATGSHEVRGKRLGIVGYGHIGTQIGVLAESVGMQVLYYDIETKLELLGEERRLESHREVMLFRGIQELMGNARDYAAANQLFVRLDMSSDLIKVDIEDNGRGFDAEAAFTGDDKHLEPRQQGLLTLKEKFELVRGSLAVTSSETDGTSIHLELPACDESTDF